MVWNKEKIKDLRQRLKISQAELAHRLGCRQQTVSEWEQGIYVPANAYGKLLTQFENSQNFVAPKDTSWLPPIQEEKGSFEVKEFDPAID